MKTYTFTEQDLKTLDLILSLMSDGPHKVSYIETVVNSLERAVQAQLAGDEIADLENELGDAIELARENIARLDLARCALAEWLKSMKERNY